MTDAIDVANTLAELERSTAILAITSRPKDQPSLTHCRLECGEQIPDARRQAVPGCELCITCQEWTERGGGFWP